MSLRDRSLITGRVGEGGGGGLQNCIRQEEASFTNTIRGMGGGGGGWRVRKSSSHADGETGGGGHKFWGGFNMRA